MTVAVDISHRLGNFTLDARFETADGLVALLGRVWFRQDIDHQYHCRTDLP